MSTSKEEQLDLDLMKEKIREIKENAIDYMVSISALDVGDLKYHGFKSYADGYEYKLKAAKAKINDLHKAHLKKWPD